jgi:predicted exporter
MKSAVSLPTVGVASPAPRRTTVSTALAAVGIVYGDLGTNEPMGLLSLVVWALIIAVSLKYCLFVMRADNHGEGGILALMSLVTSRTARGRWSAGTLVVMGSLGISPEPSSLRFVQNAFGNHVAIAQFDAARRNCASKASSASNTRLPILSISI